MKYLKIFLNLLSFILGILSRRRDQEQKNKGRLEAEQELLRKVNEQIDLAKTVGTAVDDERTIRLRSRFDSASSSD